MPNRLAAEPSPYLQQHRDNPVDWYPWGMEAFAAARERDVPLLVSIGYSSCHWCHVMAHESFEHPEIAATMNAQFVCVKVDREERPDVDALFMSAVQAMAGHGGWPLNAFATPDGIPFFGGTYWPPTDRQGMPGFPRVLRTIADAWSGSRDQLLGSAASVRTFLENSSAATLRTGALDDTLPRKAIARMESALDPVHGGFGQAPKFPSASTLVFLTRHVTRTVDATALTMLTTTLDGMARGGIHDQLGGGFARYSVDAEWLVPHFEKMLYDNAQLMAVYLDAWRMTRDPRYRDVVLGIANWLLREMELPGGGFASALDADTEGEEGRFYVWTDEEIGAVLGEDADLVRDRYGVTPGGNFEGHTVLWQALPLPDVAARHELAVEEVSTRLGNARARLLAHRDSRERPDRDDKLVTAWNGLAIGALAQTGAAFDRPDLIGAAQRAATFVLRHLRRDDGGLWRTWNDGQTRGRGVLEDVVCLAEGLLHLHATDGDPDWLLEARRLTDYAISAFRHPEGADFLDTAEGDADLAVRPRTLQDNATPAGNSIAADVLLTMATLTGETAYRNRAVALLESMTELLREHPLAFGRYLAVTERLMTPNWELVLAHGDEESESDRLAVDAMTALTLRHPDPPVMAHVRADATEQVKASFALLADRPAVDGHTTAYLCREGSCLLPARSVEELADRLAAMDAERMDDDRRSERLPEGGSFAARM